jgi:hypothetical protein
MDLNLNLWILHFHHFKTNLTITIIVSHINKAVFKQSVRKLVI